MQDPAPRRIPAAPSAVNLNRRNILAVRSWPTGCGPPSAASGQSQPPQPQSAGASTQPALQAIIVTNGSRDPKESGISEAEIENRCKPKLEGQIENLGDNVGSSSKRWFESKTYPPPKRREISAIRDFPSGCGRNLDLNFDLNPNQTEIGSKNQQIHHQEKPPNLCTDIIVWEPKTGKPNPDSSLSETGNRTLEIRSTNSSYTDLVSLGPLEQNNGNQEEAELYDFAIRTITDSKLCLRKTARKSVRGPPQLILSVRKQPKTENSNPNLYSNSDSDSNSNPNPNSNCLIIYKTRISNLLNLNPYQNNSNEQPSTQRTKIKQLLSYFHSVYRKNIQKEESNPRLNKKVNFRIDLKSAKQIKNSALYKTLNRDKAILGAVPGVEIGDEYRYRVELHLIGLHRPLQSGIDSMEFNGARVATSIVSSGGYSDEQCSSDVLIYSGSGGKPIGKKGQKSRPLDQKLEKGNLALKNSMDWQKPVRVIHGLNVGDGKKVVMNFVYDGLYMVVDYQYVDEVYNVCGKEYKAKVFKFILRRMAGQPEIGLHVAGKLKSCRVRDGFLMSDISKGKEKVPICVINTIDNERPPKFDYITSVIYPFWLKRNLLRGCNSRENCTGVKCSCAAKNGGNIPFVSNGAIVEEKRVIYECGPACKCPSSCPNRVSQKGIVYKLEVFRKESNEWGVRSLGSISCGSFVCEYVGEVREKDEAIVIDCGERGNVARFLKRCESPNLMVQKVLFDHDDERLAHLMFFSAENIPPLQELTY